MKHFDNWQWADFVRGLGDTSTRSMMSSHLSGCASCQKTADRLRAVTVEARADAEYAPPEPVLRSAQAIFAMNRPEKVSLVRLVARLVYDSAREPLAAGLRSQDRLSRRALYEAGDYHVDLQLERQPASGLITLVGQLAARRQATSITDVPVWLMERDSLVENTTCNAFGEFQLEYEPRRNLRLFLPLREAGKRMEIALDHLTPGGRTAMRGVAPVRKAPRRKSIKPA